MHQGLDSVPLHGELLDAEWDFYRRYAWCLNAFPTVHEVVGHLCRELDALGQVEEDWQRAEIMTNVFLLSCAVTDTVDDYLLGESYDFSRVAVVVPLLGPGVRMVEQVLRMAKTIRALRVKPLRGWREAWAAVLSEFMRIFVAAGTPDRNALAHTGGRLASLLATELPRDLRRLRPRIPAAFRTQDLTHFDILGLDDNLQPQQELTVNATADDGTVKSFQATVRINTPVEMDYYRNGGILHTVLRNFSK